MHCNDHACKEHKAHTNDIMNKHFFIFLFSLRNQDNIIEKDIAFFLSSFRRSPQIITDFRIRSFPSEHPSVLLHCLR